MQGVKRLGAVFQTLRRDLASDTLTMETLAALQAELSFFSNRTERLVDTFRFRQASLRAGFAESPMLIGTATAMEQIMPRDAPFTLTPARTVALSLARNEKESVQIGVLSADSALRQVCVTASALKGPRGAVLPASQIDCHVTGYVQTKRKPPYAVTHIGWWPDPILDFLGPVDIALGDVQSFWIRVRAPRNQAPGDYRGTLTVSAANAPAQTRFSASTTSPCPTSRRYRSRSPFPQVTGRSPKHRQSRPSGAKSRTIRPRPGNATPPPGLTSWPTTTSRTTACIIAACRTSRS